METNKWKNPHKKPLISVIVPTYRCAPFIERCINSLLKQTMQNTEIIIVNDASPDNIEEVIKNAFRKELSNGKIRYIKNPVNRGPSYSRNRGASIAKGKYVLFADGDDMYLPNHIETLYKTLKSGGYDVIQLFTKIYIDENDKLIIHRRYPMLGRTWFILYMLNFQTTYILISKETFFKQGGFAEDWKFGEDFHFLTKCLRSGLKLKLLDRPTALHREHPIAWQAAQARENNFSWIKYKEEKVIPYLERLYENKEIGKSEIATLIFGMIFITPMWKWPKIFMRVIKTDPFFFLKCPESWYYTLLAIYKTLRRKIKGI